jgi:hypothetical protein
MGMAAKCLEICTNSTPSVRMPKLGMDTRVKPAYDAVISAVTLLLTTVTVYVTGRFVSLYEGASPVTAD